MSDPVDKFGRPFHPLIHQTEGDGMTPRLCKSRGALRGKIALKRGDQSREGEAEYAKLVDAGSAPGPARPPRDLPRDRRPVAPRPDPARPAEPAGGSDGPGADAVEPAPQADLDDGEFYIPERMAADEADRARAEHSSSGPGRDDDEGGGVLGLCLLIGGIVGFFVLGLVGGKRWQTTPQDDEDMGLQPGGSKPAKTFQWFKHRMWDEQAIADLKAGATRVGKLLGWVDDTEGEKAKQAAAAGEGDDGGVPSTQAG